MVEESTKIDENILEAKHLKAMELKFQGKIYAEIAKELELAEVTIKSWFQTSGILFEKYYDFAEKKVAEMEKDSRLLLRREIWNAVAVINKTLRDTISVKTKCPQCQNQFTVTMDIPTVNRLKAATEVLDRVFGKSVQPIEVGGGLQLEYEQLSDEELDKRIKEIKNSQIEETGKTAGL